MTAMTLGQQLLFLRKQRAATQEELAQALGVTNQSVSKWENGACFPDIALLPKLASYFQVTIDELLGYKPANSFGDVYLKVKDTFQSSPSEESFELAYRLGFLLHEGAVSRGYRGYLPWDSDRNRTSNEDLHNWTYSACSEPEGATVMKGHAILLADNKRARPMTSGDIRSLHHALQLYSNKETLQVLLALYELTVRDFDLYVTPGQIASAGGLDEKVVSEALDALPVQIQRLDNGLEGYRLEGSHMHIPTVLFLLAP